MPYKARPPLQAAKPKMPKPKKPMAPAAVPGKPRVMPSTPKTPKLGPIGRPGTPGPKIPNYPKPTKPKKIPRGNAVPVDVWMKRHKDAGWKIQGDLDGGWWAIKTRPNGTIRREHHSGTSGPGRGKGPKVTGGF